MAASPGKCRYQPHCPSVNCAQTVGLGWDAFAVEAPSQGHDGGIRMCQYKDRVRIGMASESLGDKVRLTAPRWRRHRAPINRQKVDAILRHRRPSRTFVDQRSEPFVGAYQVRADDVARNVLHPCDGLEPARLFGVRRLAEDFAVLNRAAADI